MSKSKSKKARAELRHDKRLLKTLNKASFEKSENSSVSTPESIQTGEDFSKANTRLATKYRKPTENKREGKRHTNGIVTGANGVSVEDGKLEKLLKKRKREQDEQAETETVDASIDELPKSQKKGKHSGKPLLSESPVGKTGLKVKYDPKLYKKRQKTSASTHSATHLTETLSMTPTQTRSLPKDEASSKRFIDKPTEVSKVPVFVIKASDVVDSQSDRIAKSKEPKSKALHRSSTDRQKQIQKQESQSIELSHSDDEARKARKREKQAKKERKEQQRQDPVAAGVETENPQLELSLKSSKKRKVQEETSTEVDIDEHVPEPSKKGNKKKKTQQSPEDELEIDITRPEPPSKKKLRKAKKAAVDQDQNPVEQDDEEAAKPSQPSRTVSSKSSSNSEFGIWIGNLPFAATKDMLIEWFIANSNMTVASITRVHMPPPSDAKASKTTLKAQNKGFAYVDFATESDHTAALALSETQWNFRNVLIKDSKDFHGRPEGSGASSKIAKSSEKKPAKRIYVGNLDFSATEDDLQQLFQPCGQINHVQVAKFEDSGKCKGFAFVEFENIESAKAAVKGWGKIPEESQENLTFSREASENSKKSKKGGTWSCSRMRGRELHREFAEDATKRYEKRFGKSKHRKDFSATSGDVPDSTLRASPMYESSQPKNESLKDRLTPPADSLSEKEAGTSAIAVTELPIAALEPGEKRDRGSSSTSLSSNPDKARPQTSHAVFGRILQRTINSNKRIDENLAKDVDGRKTRAQAKLDSLNNSIAKRTGTIVQAKGTKMTFDD